MAGEDREVEGGGEEGAQEEGRLTILRRILSYADNIWKLRDRFVACKDGRKRPIIATSNAVRACFAMVLTRLGSLNAWEGVRVPSYLTRWIGGRSGSADTISRVMATLDPASLRQMLFDVFYRLKRNKAFVAAKGHGMVALVLDGHECHATYRRHCDGCMSRQIKTAGGERTQYFHRYVAAQLIGRGLNLVVDIEVQEPGDGEIAAATRLFERVVERFGRSFDVVLADALYCKGPFWKTVRSRRKDLVVVLKEEARDLMADARALFSGTPTVSSDQGTTHRETRDISGFKSWPQAGEDVRVVQSVETKTRRRQLDKKVESQTSEWIWVTSLSPAVASTDAVVALGHARWRIENEGFNELANEWHANHVYRHDGAAILALTLLTVLALDVFQVFYVRGIKPALKEVLIPRELARRILADLYLREPTKPNTG